MYFFTVPSSAICLHFPDLPRPRIRRMQGVPVAVERAALREHPRPDGGDERVQVDGNEMVLVEQGPLNTLHQALPFRRIDARLMLGPQGFDLRLADEGGGAAAHG